ncbi:dipeptidase PepV [Tumebacillus sp. DT12]|uniref:Dipeptidase PepV n=1 Tax=Tumebacillus lacus TaxID=2995335 RepID=A0ABT3X097_9BACL|nr:dipeptidase PepV [Tumebacillus lacus]MCX7568975.1 dipeptidase PepV [Tumebacillus lacus]
MFANWIDQHREEIIAATQGILRINSVGGPASGPEQPFGPGCAQALDYVLDLGRERGLTVKNVDGYAGHIEAGEGDDYVAVLAHLDVVPVGSGWTYPPFGAEIHDGKIYARGAIDDKGPAMAALFGLFAVLESGLPLQRKVRMIFGLDEETNWQCMDHYFAKEPLPVGGFTPDADFPLIYAEKGILCFDLVKSRQSQDAAAVRVRELTGGSRINMVPDHCLVQLTVQTGDATEIAATLRQTAEQQGILADIQTNGRDITLTVEGLAAHSMVPANGVNAVVHAGRLLAALPTAEPDLWQFLGQVDPAGATIGVEMTCEVTGPLTSNLGIAKVDEEQAVFSFNLRFPVDQTDTGLMDLVRETLTPAGYRVELSADVNMKPLYVPKDSEIVQKLLAVYEAEVGERAEPLTIGGGTYARAIPNAVAFGALFPGETETAHQKDEHWPVENLIRCAKIYANAIYELAK